MDRRTLLSTIVSGGVLLAGCADRSNRSDPGGGTGTGTSLAISAPSFKRGKPIPKRYTCDGDNVSPELTFSGAVEEMETLTLIVDDPDAPRDEPFVHWLPWNVPTSTETSPEGITKTARPEAIDGLQGTNDTGTVGYAGPCPPGNDDAHTYRFHLFGIDSTLDVEGGAERAALEAAMEGHVVDDAMLTGTYERA